jgi:cytochrome b pre-mRNA-processing protein 3
MFGFLGRNRFERVGYELYSAAVAAARDPALYGPAFHGPAFHDEVGVPDTLDGRFDLVGLHAFLLIRRLNGLPPPGPELAQAVFDAMFNDMDVNLREMGVGDLSVGRKVRAMWEAFHGRATVYQAAIEAGDPAALAAALERNVWRGAPAPGAAALARAALAQDAFLSRQDFSELRRGVARFLPAAQALA